MRLFMALMVGFLASCSSPSVPAVTGTGGSGGQGGGGTGGSGPASEICDNRVDDDENGKTDCADPACFQDPACPACGDGFLDPREACDGDNLGGASCTSLGFDGGGVPTCSSSCKLVTTGCRRKENCKVVGDEDGNHVADCADPACSTLPFCYQLSIKTLPQDPVVNTRVTLQFQVLDGANRFSGGVPVAVSAPEGAAVVQAVETTENGLVSFDLWLGRRPGTQVFEATVAGSGLVLPVEIVAEEAKAGTVVTVLNATHTSGQDHSGPASQAGMGSVTDVQVASDGTLYVAEPCRLLAVSPDGELSLLGGTGSCGASPEDGPALGSPLSISALALDDVGHKLYLADAEGERVRVLDLATGLLHTVAGGGTLTGAASEGQVATQVRLVPASLSLAGGDLHVSDSAGNRVVRIARDSGVLETELAASSNPATDCNGTLALQDCSSGCRTVVSGDTAFVAGMLCGTDPGAGKVVTLVPGIVRLGSDKDASPVRIAGAAASTADGLARGLAFGGPVAAAFDGQGNLFAAADNTLFRIDGLTTHATYLNHEPSPGFSGDAGPLSGASFWGPSALTFGSGQDLYVADTGNGAVRRVVGIGATGAASVHIAAVSGDNQTAPVGTKLAQPLAFEATLPDGSQVTAQATLRALDPGATVYEPAVGQDGSQSRSVRLGIVPGQEAFQVTLQDLRGHDAGKPLVFHEVATAPAAGVMVPVTGADGADVGSLPLPQNMTFPAPSSRVYVRGVVPSSDGTIYLATYCQVLQVGTDGGLKVFAGTAEGCNNETGDGGPALAAGINPWSLSLDDPGRKLYMISERSLDFSYTLRQVDLATGIITTVAGGGTQQPAAGVPATHAKFTYLTSYLDGGGQPYLVGFGSVFRVDAATGLLAQGFPGVTCPSGDPIGAIYSAVFDGAAAYLSVGCGFEYDIVRVEGDGQLTVVKPNEFAYSMVLDPQRALVYVYGSLIKRVDPTTGVVTTLADLGTSFASSVGYTAAGRLVYGGYGPVGLIW